MSWSSESAEINLSASMDADRSAEVMVLCAYCTTLPRTVVDTTWTTENGQVSESPLSYPASWTVDACQTQCQLGSLMRATAQQYNVISKEFDIFRVPAEEDSSSNSHVQFCIRASSTLPYKTAASLQLSGWLECERLPRSLQEQLIHTSLREMNWDLIRSWFNGCRAYHGPPCEPQPLRMTGLSMIDCRARKTVPAPMNCQYAALSYVWGTEVDNSVATPSDSFVEVVEDAITCTLALGLRFLWVDRHCIDQASADKHEQIQNMDQIYGSATITLVNAAGESPREGFPGVSATAKVGTESFFMDGRKALPIANVRRDIRESTWYSRGWTFQESLLSIRRLVFTKSQTYYQCTAMHRCESVPHRLLSHPTSKIPARQSFRQDFNEAMLALPQLYPDSSHSLMAGFDMFLTEYLRRRLSYPSDALNAFMGLLRHFWKQKERPIWHFWGVPFWSALNDGYSSGNFVFIKQLLWIPVQRRGSERLTKRDGFPSWTWAAWEGLASWILTDANEQRLIWDKYFDVKVRVEGQSGKRLDMAEYVEAMTNDFDMYKFKPCLYLSGWSVKARIRRLAPDPSGNDSYLMAYDARKNHAIARVQIMDVHLPNEPSRNSSSAMDSTCHLLLFVGRDVTDTWSGRTRFGIKVRVAGLVLRPTNDNKTYSRLGVLESCDKFELQVKKGNKRAYLRRDSTEEWSDCKWYNIKLI